MSYAPTERGLGGRRVDALGDAFYPLYRLLFGENNQFVADLERKLSEARMSHNVELYLSLALAGGVLGGVTLAAFGLATGYALFATGVLTDGPLIGLQVTNATLLQLIIMLRVPFVIGLIGTVLGGIGFATVFGTFVALPYSRAARRRREINMLLPDAVSFMYALSVGGMGQLEIFEAVAETEGTYGEVAREFRMLLLETQYFDTDYRSAIRQQAIETPSEDLSQFLTDMLSVIDSGGDLTRFLEDKKTLHFRTAKQQQQRILETLELFAEVYVTISLFPLLLLIVLIVLLLLGQGRWLILYATVYGLIPLLGLAFLVIVATVKQDDPGDGTLRTSRDDDLYEESGRRLFESRLVEEYVGSHRIFDRIRKRQGTHETLRILGKPHVFFRDNPVYTLALTVPAAAVVVGAAILSGRVPTTLSGLAERSLLGTAVYLYVPLLLTGIPLAVFREWNVRRRRVVLRNLSETLRKLSSANDTGMTLLEAMDTVAKTSTGRLAEEFRTIYEKSRYGMNLEEALVVFNNKYRLPRLARTVKLISKAQEVSSQISAVLTTAAQATENRDDIERERKSRTRMQVAVILLTYLTLLGVMAALKAQFFSVMDRLATAGGSGAATGFGSAVNTDRLSLLFFHAVTLQAVVSGLVCGYIREANLTAGVKYMVGLLTIALGVWVIVA